LPTGEPFVAQTADAPSPEPRQVFAIGLNYLAHQVEAGFPRPTEPMVFTKFASSICGPVGDLTLFTDDVDWEAEMAIVIGTRAYQVPERDAWSYVAGVTAAQDFSARSVQMRPAGTLQFSPLGSSSPGSPRWVRYWSRPTKLTTATTSPSGASSTARSSKTAAQPI